MSAPAVAAMLGERSDLTTLDTRQELPWTRGAEQITRPGLRVIWFGARGSGKSLAALILAVQVTEAGGSATYLDLENGPRRQARRLAAILADRPESTRAAVAERLDYRPAPRLHRLDSDDAISEWAALFTGTDLLVIDSTARVLAQLSLDEDRTADFGRFTVAYIDPPASQGTSVILLDNTGWAEAERSRGASGKWDMVELVYKVAGTDFAADKAGTITLERKRSRDGDEARQLVAHVGEGTYSPLHVPAVSERDAAVTEALLAYIAEHPGSTTTEIAKGISQRRTECASQLAAMEDAGTGTGTVTQRPSETRDSRGVPHKRKGWYLASESQLAAVPQNGTSTDTHSDEASECPGPPSPKDGPETQPTRNGHGHLSIADAEAVAAEFERETA